MKIKNKIALLKKNFQNFFSRLKKRILALGLGITLFLCTQFIKIGSDVAPVAKNISKTDLIFEYALESADLYSKGQDIHGALQPRKDFKPLRFDIFQCIDKVGTKNRIQLRQRISTCLDEAANEIEANGKPLVAKHFRANYMEEDVFEYFLFMRSVDDLIETEHFEKYDSLFAAHITKTSISHEMKQKLYEDNRRYVQANIIHNQLNELLEKDSLLKVKLDLE